MPYITVMKKFTDGKCAWLEPERVWVEPTPEEKLAEEAKELEHQSIMDDFLGKTNRLIDDMKEALDPPNK